MLATRINQKGVSLWCGKWPFEVLKCGRVELWGNLKKKKLKLGRWMGSHRCPRIIFSITCNTQFPVSSNLCCWPKLCNLEVSAWENLPSYSSRLNFQKLGSDLVGMCGIIFESQGYIQIFWAHDKYHIFVSMYWWWESECGWSFGQHEGLWDSSSKNPLNML